MCFDLELLTLTFVQEKEEVSLVVDFQMLQGCAFKGRLIHKQVSGTSSLLICDLA